ncbi:MAG: DMT family transporter [Clostridiales bacterium]|nr:DMT family transporter [Clostridiales bacterium]
MTKGKLFLVLSAFFYGVLPVLASIAYRGGINGVTLSFLRSSMSVPILYIMIKADKKSLKLTRKQVKSIINLAVIGGALPIVLLYLSYNYIPTGLATTLHFIYPLVIVLASAILYHERMSRVTLCSVLLVTIGIFMFSDISVKVSKVGIILALLSGIFYSFYVIYMDKTSLDRMDYIVLTFYVMLIMSISIFVFGLITRAISFSFSPLSWSFGAIISLLTTLGAMPLLQIGIRYEGASTAGIISTVEPITTIILGAAFLGEIVGTGQIIGGALIIFGVLLSQRKQNKQFSH